MTRSDDPDRSGRWWHRGWAKVVLVVLGVLVGAGLVAVVLWELQLPGVEPAPLQAVLDDPDLEVTRGDDTVTLRSADGSSDVTVVFYPGAGVAPDAYLAAWAPVVEEVGLSVVIPSMPLRLAALDRDAAASLRTAATQVGGEVPGSWWVGGHSLGGAMAASFVAGTPPSAWDGLVLWAAYPNGDALADRDDLTVVSVSGSRDARTTPEDIEASREALPDTTQFVELDGVNHAQFGAYGQDEADGIATVDDEAARAAIARATADAVLGADTG